MINNLIKVMAGVVLALGLNAGLASAAVSCSISNTGPGSTNTCEFDNETTIDYQCSNGVLINLDTDQQVTSGDASVIDNNNSGNASSGNASNQSSSLVDVVASCAKTIANNKPEEQPKPRVDQPTKPQGGGNVEGASDIKTLPATGSSDLATWAAGAAALTTAAILVSAILSTLKRSATKV